MLSKSWRMWLVLVGVLVLTIVVAVSNRGRHDSNGPIRVGVILALTGPADFIGKPERDVLEGLLREYGRDEHTRSRIELRIEDSGGNVEQALNIFQRFAQDTSVVAVIGPSTSGESVALAREAESLRLPLLSLAASRDIVLDESGRTNEWAFKFAQNDDLAAERLLRAMLSNQDTTVALLYSNDGFGKSGARVFRAAADSSRTVRVVHEFAFPAALTQPGAVLATVPPSVDAVLIWGTAPGPALLVKALRQQRSQAQVYLSHGNASGDFLAAAGPASEGAVVVGSRVLLGREFLNDSDPRDAVILSYGNFWRQNFAGEPSHFGGHAHDALVALNGILDSAPQTRKGVRDGLERLTNFHGVTGGFRFSPNDHAGLDVSAFETYVIRQGQFIPLRR